MRALEKRSLALLAEQRRFVTVLLLAVVVILAAGVRSVGLDSNPPGFFADEAAVGFNGFSLLTTGRDEYGTLLPVFIRSFGEYKFPIFIYGTIPFIAVLGLTEQAVRLTAAAFGTLTVISVFFLARTLFNNDKAALASAFLLAITPGISTTAGSLLS